MSYSILSELPSQVKSSMNEEQQAEWMGCYNNSLLTHNDFKVAYTEAWNALATKEVLRTFSGWCSVDTVDRQGDKVSPEALALALEPFIYTFGGNFNDSHSNRNVGCIYKFEVREHSEGILGVYVFGCIYQGQEIFDKVWSEIKSGVKPAMSVGIYITDAKPTCDDSKCWLDIKALEIFEISTVIRPACKEALQEDINMKAKSETITNCPYCKIIYPQLVDKVADAEGMTLTIAKEISKMVQDKEMEAPVEPKPEEAPAVEEKCEAPKEEPIAEPVEEPKMVEEKADTIVVKADDLGALTQVLQNMMVLLQDIHKVALAPKPEVAEPVAESAPAAQAEPESVADEVAESAEGVPEAEEKAEEEPAEAEAEPEAEKPEESEEEKKALKQKADVDSYNALRYKAMAEGVKTQVPEASVPIAQETSFLNMLNDKRKLATLSVSDFNSAN